MLFGTFRDSTIVGRIRIIIITMTMMMMMMIPIYGNHSVRTSVTKPVAMNPGFVVVVCDPMSAGVGKAMLQTGTITNQTRSFLSYMLLLLKEW